MRFYSTLFAAGILLTACSKKDNTPPTPTGPVTQQEINSWMLDSMRTYYLWNTALPQNTTASTATAPFFNTLKAATDSFSVVYNPFNGSVTNTSLLERFGLDFNIIDWPTATGGSIGIITLVIPGSVADQAGWKRGNYFARINDVVLSKYNAASLSNTLLTAVLDGTLTKATISNGQISEGIAIGLTPNHLPEPALYQQTTLLTGNQKTGYLFYNTFDDASTSALINTFQGFKTGGVHELILDLRYNAGGSVAAAAALCAMIAPNVNGKSAFVQFSGNNHLGQHFYTFDDLLATPVSGTAIPFATLAAANLSLPRVFILSTKQTASAAELVINNLKPFTQVIQIGETTYGKDKASVVIIDKRLPQRIPWVLRPIAYLLANAGGAGNYATSITPQQPVQEMATQPLLPLGDAGDPLVAKALSMISGNGRMQDVANANVHVYYRSQVAEDVVLPK